MQPMAGTRPAREEAADTDAWTGLAPRPRTRRARTETSGPQTARPRSPASARPGLSTAADDGLLGSIWLGDMRLCRPRGPQAPNLAPPSPRAARVAAPTVHTDHLAQDRSRSRRRPPPGATALAGAPAARRRAVGARRARADPAGRPGTRRRADRTSVETASTTPRPRTTSTTNTTTTRSTTSPTASPLPRYLTFTTSTAFPRDRPLTAFPVSYSSLAHPHARPPPACRRPASGPPATCLGCPARFIWQVEEGGSSAKRWTPLPRKPRREAKSGPEAGRRPVDLLRPTTRDQHPQTNTKKRTGAARGEQLCQRAASVPRWLVRLPLSLARER